MIGDDQAIVGFIRYRRGGHRPHHASLGKAVFFCQVLLLVSRGGGNGVLAARQGGQRFYRFQHGIVICTADGHNPDAPTAK